MSEKTLAELAQEWLLNEVRGGYQVQSRQEGVGSFVVSEVSDVCSDCLDQHSEGSATRITWAGSVCGACGRRIIPD